MGLTFIVRLHNRYCEGYSGSLEECRNDERSDYI